MTVEITDFVEDKNVDLELIGSFGINKVEKLWNLLQIRGIKPENERDTAIRLKCIEVLEKLYRKPWDETIFFKLIQMHLEMAKYECNVRMEMSKIKRLFGELEISCPFMPKHQLKRNLELKIDFIILKLKSNNENDALCNELVEVLVEHKKRGFKIDPTKLLDFFKSTEGSIEVASKLEPLLPNCEEFLNFHVDLLNIMTELKLNQASLSKKTIHFSHLLTEAINLNVKSLAMKPNVMGYFEFLKLTKLQNPSDFGEAIELCLSNLKNRVAPNDEIIGKIQIIRLICNESGDLKRSLQFAYEIFRACDFSSDGSIIIEELINLIESNTKTRDALVEVMEDFIKSIADWINANLKCHETIFSSLLRLAEKNSSVKRDFERSEGLLVILKGLGVVSDEKVNKKLLKCYLKLDKLDEAREIIDQADTPDLSIILRLEYYLRVQNEVEAFVILDELIEDESCRSEDLLSLYNQLKVRLNSDIQLKILQTAEKRELKKKIVDQGKIVDLIRAKISIIYSGIIESGLNEDFERALESYFTDVKNRKEFASEEQIIWICQVCWNLGVIHARAEDYSNAKFGFYWCFELSKDHQSRDLKEKAAFYYLTAKMCELQSEIEEGDFELVKLCESGLEAEFTTQLTCLKLEMFIRAKKWPKLSKALLEIQTNTQIVFETVAEIVLRTNEEIPLEIYLLVLKKMTENEFNRADFNIERFAELFRGMTMCALLQFPNDLNHFEKALAMVKSSFGGYPNDEVTWFCSTALEMGRKAYDEAGRWDLAERWTEMAMNFVYLISEAEAEDKMIKVTLQEKIHQLFDKIIKRN